MKNQNRTQAYYTTVKMIDGQVAPEDQASLDGLKMVVKMHNTAHPLETSKYVKLQGRGPRAVHSEARYGKGRRRGYDQSLPLGLATHADVYVYNRYDR